MEKIGYVYLTTNLVNGKMYVGQHLSEGFDTGYKGSGTYIMRALDKYGWNNFKCEVICWCSTQEELNYREDHYIKLLGTMSPNGYNLKGGGSHGRYSKESRKKQSEASKKRFENPEERKKQSEAKKKYYANEENRKKHSESKKKYWKNEEARKNISDTKKKYYESGEGKNVRKRISESVKKYFENEENRKKQSEAHKGKKATEETRKKHSEDRKKRWENEEYRKNHQKTVFQYTLDGTFVKEWASLSEIQRVLGFNKGNISACCLKKQHYKSAYDCLWSYEPLY